MLGDFKVQHIEQFGSEQCQFQQNATQHASSAACSVQASQTQGQPIEPVETDQESPEQTMQQRAETQQQQQAQLQVRPSMHASSGAAMVQTVSAASTTSVYPHIEQASQMPSAHSRQAQSQPLLELREQPSQLEAAPMQALTHGKHQTA